MSAPFRRLVAPPLSLDALSPCACRRAPQTWKARLEQTRRLISSSPAVFSGHSKWSTIKHDKGKADAAKSKQRSLFTKDISIAVKLGGPDPNLNSRLALAMHTAKKAAVPKTSIEAAIARGQGLSATGAALEAVVVEAMLPPAVAAIIEFQTDNRLRTLMELRLLIKNAGGSVSPVGYMFEKKGRIALQKKDGVGAEEVLEPALEAGVLDVVEDAEGRVVLYTEPAETKTTAETVAKSLGMEIEEMDIMYDANEDTKVMLDDAEAAEALNAFLEKVQDLPGLQGMYLNWAKGAIEEDLWAELQRKTAV